MMPGRRAILVAVLLGVVAVLVLVLAGGIESIELAPGRVLSAESDGDVPSAGWRGDPGGTFALPGFDPFKILLPVSLGVLVLSIAFSIRDRRLRPHLLASMLLFAAAVLTMNFVVPSASESIAEPVEETEEEPLDIPRREATAATTRVETPPPHSGSRWPIIVSTALAAILIALVVLPVAAGWLRRRRHRSEGDTAAIVDIAADAARRLESGEDPVGVVQRCYARMLRVLSDRARVDPTYRTPREFAEVLREAGLGSESVDALTEMFEFVRYGGRADERFAKRAYGCLSALRLSHRGR